MGGKGYMLRHECCGALTAAACLDKWHEMPPPHNAFPNPQSLLELFVEAGMQK